MICNKPKSNWDVFYQVRKVLVYSNYFYPDTGVIAQIYTELCERLSYQFEIQVICAIPCYNGTVAEEYREKRFYAEKYKNIGILRVRVARFSKQKKGSRMWHVLSYFFNACLATLRVGRKDIVLTYTQPPILGGLLGVVGKWITRGKLIYNIQDFNPEQTAAIGYFKNSLLLNAMMILDKWSCRNADLIITVGGDMQKTLEKRFMGKKVPPNTVINNWIDENEIYPLPKGDPVVQRFRKQYGLDGKFVIMYSGNLGLYYDLENILRVIGEFALEPRVVFAFVGDGAVKEKLVSECKKHGFGHIAFIPYQDKENLRYSLNAADVHLITNARGIKGVSIPSKIYGVLAANVPMLGILEPGSEAWEIIERSKSGILAETGNYEAIYKAIRRILNERDAFVDEHQTGRQYLIERYTKTRSIAAYVTAINTL